MFAELNNEINFTYKIPEDAKIEFCKLNSISQSVALTVRSIIPNNKGKFGLQYLVYATDEDGNIFGVNLPSHQNDMCAAIRKNEKMVEAINAGKCGIKSSAPFETKNGFTSVKAVWCDI